MNNDNIEKLRVLIDYWSAEIDRLITSINDLKAAGASPISHDRLKENQNLSEAIGILQGLVAALAIVTETEEALDKEFNAKIIAPALESKCDD